MLSKLSKLSVHLSLTTWTAWAGLILQAIEAMDGGSGFEFVLPHLSASDREGPSKAIAGHATVPMKVMNGLVHGDNKSHVIISPGVVGTTAKLTCDCLGIMINTAFEEHGMLPLM